MLVGVEFRKNRRTVCSTGKVVPTQVQRWMGLMTKVEGTRHGMREASRQLRHRPVLGRYGGTVLLPYLLP
jgi:hypothetical protein